MTLNKAFALLSSAPHLLNAEDVSGKCSKAGVTNTTNECRLKKDISLPSPGSQGISPAFRSCRELCEQWEVLGAMAPWLGASCLAGKRHSESAASQCMRAAVSVHNLKHYHSN